MVIEIPHPVNNDEYEKMQIVIEAAFNALVTTAISEGFNIVKPMGLMYIPHQEDTQQFSTSCKSILQSLMAGI